MKKWIKVVLGVAVVGLIVGVSAVYYVFHMPHRNVEGEKPAFTVSAADLFNEFNTDETASTAKYANQVIEVSGDVVEITKEGYQVSLVLNDETEGVNCSLDSVSVVENKEIIDNLKNGDKVTIKGKCDGFDMIMGVVLTSCFLEK
jgi:hypothetical protein